MLDYLPEYLNYWFIVGPNKFLRVFWYFVLFEFTRYVIVDYILYIHYYLYRKRQQKVWERAKNKLILEHPFVSIIVPGKNEGKHLFKLTKSLSEQTYSNFELIVVDDGSDDQTSIIGKNLQLRGLIDLFVVNSQRGGKASAANIGLNFAKGQFIVHLDADCSFDADAIEKILVPFYLDSRIGAVGGNVKVRGYQGNLCASLQAIEYLKTVSVGRIITSKLRIYKIISGAFGAFDTQLLKNLGGWDIGPGLDGDITVKFRKAGHRIFFSPSAICLTSVPPTFRKLAKQRLRWDKSIIRFRLRKHRDIFYPNANFNWLNFFSLFENIFYNLILNITWWIYVIDILLNFSGSLRFIIPMNITLYVVFTYVQMGSILLFSERSAKERELCKIAWLMPLYTGLFLRLVRSYAYFKEYFFKASYDDPWNPVKSSRQAKQFGF